MNLFSTNLIRGRASPENSRPVKALDQVIKMRMLENFEAPPLAEYMRVLIILILIKVHT